MSNWICVTAQPAAPDFLFVCFFEQHEQLKEEVTSNSSSATTPETVRKVDDGADDNKSSGGSSFAASDSPRPADKVEKQPDLPAQITEFKSSEVSIRNLFFFLIEKYVEKNV